MASRFHNKRRKRSQIPHFGAQSHTAFSTLAGIGRSLALGESGIAATALIPGVGPVLAAGIAGAAILGTGGLIVGAEWGGAAEEKSTAGLPSDEIFVL